MFSCRVTNTRTLLQLPWQQSNFSFAEPVLIHFLRLSLSLSLSRSLALPEVISAVTLDITQVSHLSAVLQPLKLLTPRLEGTRAVQVVLTYYKSMNVVLTHEYFKIKRLWHHLIQ